MPKQITLFLFITFSLRLVRFLTSKVSPYKLCDKLRRVVDHALRILRLLNGTNLKVLNNIVVAISNPFRVIDDPVGKFQGFKTCYQLERKFNEGFNLLNFKIL